MIYFTYHVCKFCSFKYTTITWYAPSNDVALFLSKAKRKLLHGKAREITFCLRKNKGILWRLWNTVKACSFSKKKKGNTCIIKKVYKKLISNIVTKNSFDSCVKWITVESSLFVGDQCSLLSWVALAQDFTSPQTFNIYENYHELATNEITSPQNRKMLVNNEHWLPRIPKYI